MAKRTKNQQETDSHQTNSGRKEWLKRPWWFQESEPVAKFTGWLVFYTLMLVVVAGLQWRTLASTDRAFHDQLKIAGDQLTEFKTSNIQNADLVAAIKRSVETSQSQSGQDNLKAILSIETNPGGPFIFNNGVMFPLTVVLTNEGRSQANNISLYVAMFAQGQGKARRDPNEERRTLCGGTPSRTIDKLTAAETISKTIPLSISAPDLARGTIKKSGVNYLIIIPLQDTKSFLAPTIIGCVGYKSASDNKAHRIEFIGSVSRINAEGERIPIDFSEREIPADDLQIKLVVGSSN
jgi:hypothetical protein